MIEAMETVMEIAIATVVVLILLWVIMNL